jgi:hypothetical protein
MKNNVIINDVTPATGVYLAKKEKSKVVHFWTGADTVCRRYSTGEGFKEEDYEIVTNTLGRDICHQCAVVAIRDKLDV